MALTVETQRAWTGDRMVKGMRISAFTGKLAATTDYSTTPGSEGIDLSTAKSTLGLGSVSDVLACNVKAAAGTMKPLLGVFYPDTQRLRLLKGGAGPLVEVTPASDLAVGDLFQMTILGG